MLVCMQVCQPKIVKCQFFSRFFCFCIKFSNCRLRKKMLVFMEYVCMQGKPSLEKNSILRKSFIKQTPPPRRSFMKLYFFCLARFAYCFENRATDGAAITFFFKVFSSMKIFKFLQGLVGFGNLRFAEIKSCPSTYPTYELRKVEIPHSL